MSRNNSSRISITGHSRGLLQESSYQAESSQRSSLIRSHTEEEVCDNGEDDGMMFSMEFNDSDMHKESAASGTSGRIHHFGGKASTTYPEQGSPRPSEAGLRMNEYRSVMGKISSENESACPFLKPSLLEAFKRRGSELSDNGLDPRVNPKTIQELFAPKNMTAKAVTRNIAETDPRYKFEAIDRGDRAGNLSSVTMMNQLGGGNNWNVSGNKKVDDVNWITDYGHDCYW